MENTQIEMGSIGWEDDAEYVFPGTDENDGHTLIRVQLFSGKDPTVQASPKRAQGTKLICHINALTGMKIPTKDSRCYVAIPAGMFQTPGAGIIIGTIEPSKAQLDNLKAGEVSSSAGNGTARVIQRNDGSVTLFTTDDATPDGKSVYVTVAPDAFKFVAPWGTMTFDSAGFRVLDHSGASIALGGIGLPAPLDAIGSYVRVQGGTFNASCSTASIGGTAQDSLTSFNGVQTNLIALQQQLNVISNSFGNIVVALAALSAITAPPGVPGTALISSFAALSDVKTAIDAAAGQLTANLAFLPSGTSSS